MRRAVSQRYEDLPSRLDAVDPKVQSTMWQSEVKLASYFWRLVARPFPEMTINMPHEDQICGKIVIFLLQIWIRKLAKQISLPSP